MTKLVFIQNWQVVTQKKTFLEGKEFVAFCCGQIKNAPVEEIWGNFCNTIALAWQVSLAFHRPFKLRMLVAKLN